MSHFYGTVEGQAETIVTRQGSKKSNLTTICASFQGAIKCSTYIINDIDCVRIEKIPWKGNGICDLIYSGPIGAFS